DFQPKETGWRHAHNDKWMALNPHTLANNGTASAQFVLPVGVADDCRRIRAATLVILRTNEAANSRAQAEQANQVSSGKHHAAVVDLACAAQVERADGPSCNRAESLLPRPDGLIKCHGQVGAAAPGSSTAAGFADGCGILRIFNRQRAHAHGIEQLENCG